MASNAGKQTSKAKINVNLTSNSSNGGGKKKNYNTKKNKNKAKKTLKKLGVKGVVICLLFCLIGVGVGFGACALVCKNDTFTINGADEMSLTLGDKYQDEGVKIVSFGRNVSNTVSIETNLKTDGDKYYADEIGTYYIVYKSSDIKYGKIFIVQKIRLITFVEPNEEDINVDGD